MISILSFTIRLPFRKMLLCQPKGNPVYTRELTISSTSCRGWELFIISYHTHAGHSLHAIGCCRTHACSLPRPGELSTDLQNIRTSHLLRLSTVKKKSRSENAWKNFSATNLYRNCTTWSDISFTISVSTYNLCLVIVVCYLLKMSPVSHRFPYNSTKLRPVFILQQPAHQLPNTSSRLFYFLLPGLPTLEID